MCFYCLNDSCHNRARICGCSTTKNPYIPTPKTKAAKIKCDLCGESPQDFSFRDGKTLCLECALTESFKEKICSS